MSRITSCFKRLAETKRKALVPYIVAGDPNLQVTVPVMQALVREGADIIELGVPFSDPMAEGPAIQLGHERALAHHVTLKQVLEQVRVFRQSDPDTPVVLMGYANPVEVLGYEEFAFLASDAGIDGVLIVDMPPEEAGDLQGALKKVGIDLVFLVAPTTSSDRMAKIAAVASGYLYYVSLKGVTGAGHLDIDSVATKMAELRTRTDLPVTVGFGIKDAESARQVANVAEGVVVGSLLVAKMGELAAAGTQDIATVSELTSALIRPIRQGLDA